MRKSRLSQVKQDRLIEHFVACTTARCAASLIGVNRKTAAYYFHRLRDVIAYRLEQEADQVVGGEIEVDESYFGGRRKGKRGRSAAGTHAEAHAVTREGRASEVWTLDEVARVIVNFRDSIGEAKRVFHGARVIDVRVKSIDWAVGDELPFEMAPPSTGKS